MSKTTDVLRKSAEWHQMISEELKNPEILETLPPERIEKKLRRITTQQERHALFSRTLHKAAKLALQKK